MINSRCLFVRAIVDNARFRKCCEMLLLLCCYSAAIGADSTVFWVDGSEPTSMDERRIVPASYRNVRIELATFSLELTTVPHETNVSLHESDYLSLIHI